MQKYMLAYKFGLVAQVFTHKREWVCRENLLSQIIMCYICRYQWLWILCTEAYSIIEYVNILCIDTVLSFSLLCVPGLLGMEKH